MINMSRFLPGPSLVGARLNSGCDRPTILQSTLGGSRVEMSRKFPTKRLAAAAECLGSNVGTFPTD